MALIIISVLFFVILGIKNFFKKSFCVICGAVSLTWLGLLILYWQGIFTDVVTVSLLVGETILALYYLFDAKAKEELKFFRLPFLLSLITTAYFVITFSFSLNVLFLLVGLWFAFLIIYSFRYKSVAVESFMSSVMECCKRW